MARQIIRDEYASGDPTARQRAFNQGMQMLTGASSNLYKQGIENEERTARQAALERQQQQQDMATAMDLSNQSGMDITADDVRRIRSGETAAPAEGMGPMPLGLSDITRGIREKSQAAQSAAEKKELNKEERAFRRQKELKQMDADSRKPKDGKPKQLSSAEVRKVQEGEGIPTLLKDVEDVLATSSDVLGPIQGRIAGMNPYNEKAQAVQSQMKAASQAFGRFMEGGVLRKEDEEKYAKMFPGLSDTPETAANKLAIVKRMMEQKQKGDIDALSKAGYDISPFLQRSSVSALPGVVQSQAPLKSAPQGFQPLDESGMAQFQPSQQVQMPFDAQASQSPLMQVDPKKGQLLMNLRERARAAGQR